MLFTKFNLYIEKVQSMPPPDCWEEEKVEGPGADDEAGAERVLLEAVSHDTHDGEEDLRGGARAQRHQDLGYFSFNSYNTFIACGKKSAKSFILYSSFNRTLPSTLLTRLATVPFHTGTSTLSSRPSAVTTFTVWGDRDINIASHHPHSVPSFLRSPEYKSDIWIIVKLRQRGYGRSLKGL